MPYSQNNIRVKKERAFAHVSRGLDNIDKKKTGEFQTMAKNKAALEKFKMEAANEVGVTLKQGYNGDITARQAGSVGGQMVKKMIESYENSMTPSNNG